MQTGDVIIRVQQLLDETTAFIENSSWRNKYSLALKSLQEELNTPCVLAVAGKVKAGKSFLVNALLGIDIAMTGNTETTATVNIFKKGSPPSKDKPILCSFVDGHREWVSKEYFDSLQGTSEEALSKTAQIDKLIMYINNNPLLDYVTLVDTPGIGAVVGEDGDSHQIHTDSYFMLRARHQQDTINLSNTADAVVYLFNTVPTETDKSFLNSLYNNGHGLTSLNGIGVLSKIDKDLSQCKNLPRFCSEFERNLFTIVPTSAAIERYMPSIDKAKQLQEKLRNGFTAEKGLELALGSETSFLYEKLPYCKLSVEERKAILNSFSASDLAWSSFVFIAKELYYAEDLVTTLEKIKEVGGIQHLRDLIFKHFFNRSHMLRGNKIVEELRRIISSMMYDPSFVLAEHRARMKDKCIQSCKKNLPAEIQSVIIDLIKNNVPSIEHVQSEKDNLSRINVVLQQLQSELKMVNDNFLMYQYVMDAQDQFNQAEIEELCSLFSGQTNKFSPIGRYKYWNAVFNSSVTNSIRQNAAKVARNKYAELIKQ